CALQHRTKRHSGSRANGRPESTAQAFWTILRILFRTAHGHGFWAREPDDSFELDLDRKPVPTFRHHALKPVPRKDRPSPAALRAPRARLFFCSPPVVTSAQSGAVLF